MKISVALCTYNGEKYISRQIQSILQQTYQVNEIVICDDGSKDGTISILNAIIKENKQCNIRLFQNNPNLGVCLNFKKAISLCSGDLIFLSDQDDVWKPTKVSIVVSKFRKSKNTNVIFTNAFFIDESDNKIHTDKSLFDVVGFDKKHQLLFDKGGGFELFMSSNVATGATMAIRSSFQSEILVLENSTSRNGLPLHDYSISMSALFSNSLDYISEPLIYYRIHNNQDCGLGDWIKTPPRLSNVVIPYNYYNQIDVWKEYLPESFMNRLNFAILRFWLPSGFFVRLKSVLRRYSEYKLFYPEFFLKMMLVDILNIKNSY